MRMITCLIGQRLLAVAGPFVETLGKPDPFDGVPAGAAGVPPGPHADAISTRAETIESERPSGLRRRSWPGGSMPKDTPANASDQSAACSATEASSAAAVGRKTWNDAPPPTRSCTHARPPCSSAKLDTTA